MRYWALTGILVLSFLLQSAVSTHLAIGDVAPNFVLVVVVCYGLLFGPEVGLVAGAIGGLLIDLTTGLHVGNHVLALALVGWLVGQVEERVFKDNLLLAAVGGFLGSLVSQSMVLTVLWIFGRKISLWGSLRHPLLPSAIYDMVLCVLVYGFIYRYYRYLRPDPRGTISLRRR